MISTDDVASWSGITVIGSQEQTILPLIVDAVNVYVESLPHIDRDEAGQWAATTHLGAILLAARLYRRKNSPGGIEAVGDSMSYIARYDSDISRLLNTDSFRKPVVG